MSALPTHPWKEVSIDFSDLPTGEHLLVIIDDYSRFPVVEILTSTSSKAVIPHLDRIFALFGIPEVVRTDNGPPFNSEYFMKFAQYLGFRHRRITPQWPQANGEVERFMCVLKKVVRTATAERKSWKQELYTFLRNYRATPHRTSGAPPATIMFQRPIRTRLPEPQSHTANDSEIRNRNKSMKQKQKVNAEKHQRIRESEIRVGNYVLVKRDGHIGKFTTPFDTRTLKVIAIKDSQIVASRGSYRVTRNSSHFKVLKGQHDIRAAIDDYDDTPSPQIANPPRNERIQTPPMVARRNPPRNRAPSRNLNDYYT
ncbi:hypothetical protein BSL78_11236 [Apostichopus japonicus]|uniref:Integrase catalytic domain-containing protein n=1 Tax=Stichopus japonicus TaxID=307972 RepID=A0A2G8KV37_STIJA|nr:hypothetical protein BSL78_11236 [Apostichopus japonicus]